MSTVAEALTALGFPATGETWVCLRGDTYAGIEWAIDPPPVSEAEVLAKVAELQAAPPKDWEGFREALYGNAAFLDFLESSPLAAKLDDLIWRRQFTPLAATLWNRLKSQGMISSELEAQVAAAAGAANLLEELAIVTGSGSAE